MIFNMVGGGSSGGGMPKFSYTGTYNLVDDGDGNWRIKFLTSGKLTFDKSPGSIDVFLCGGGGGGRNPAYPYGNVGWGGGGGGYTTTVLNALVPEKNKEYEIVVGAGGAVDAVGGKSTAFSLSAEGGKIGASGYSAGESTEVCGSGGAGGSGGGGGAVWTKTGGAGGTDGGNGSSGGSQSDSDWTIYGGSGGTGQGTNTCEFGEDGATIYGCGGGGGGGQEGSGGKG